MKTLFSPIRMLCLLLLGVFSLQFAQAADTAYDYSSWIVGTTAAEVNYAVRTAQSANRPLVVLYSNLSNCAHCKGVWNNALCDGGVHHTSNCAISSTHAITKYAKENKLVLLLITTVVEIKYSKVHQEIIDSLKNSTGNIEYSTVAIFNVPASVNASSSSNTAVLDKKSGIQLIGKFRIVGGSTASYNGNSYSFPSSDTSVKETHFEKAMALFFPNDYFSTIEPPVVDLSGYKNAVAITPAEASTTASCALDSTSKSEQWFSFTAVKGNKYNFTASTPSATSKSYGYAFYTTAGINSGTALKESVLTANTILTDGFSLSASSAGTTYLRIYQTEMSSTKSSFTLTYSVEASSSSGDDSDSSDSDDSDTKTEENQGEWEYSNWIVGTQAADVMKAVAAAAKNARPLVVLYSNLSNCAHCKGVWNYALCDGGAYHKDSNCNVKKSSHPILEYARKKKLVLLLITTAVEAQYSKEHQAIIDSLKNSTGNIEYSTIAIFNVPEDVNTSNTGNTAILGKSGGLNYIGKFRIVGGSTASYNGKSYDFPSSDTSVKETDFENALELFFPNDYFSSIDPPVVAQDWEQATEIAEFTHTQNTTGKETLVTTDTDGKTLTLSLNGSTTTQWYKFNAEEGRRYHFISYSNPTVSSDINVTVEFKSGDGTEEPVSLSPERIKTSAGGSVISNGFYIDADEDGIYYIKISRDGDSSVEGLTYNLSAYDTPIPQIGAIANPNNSSDVTLGEWTTYLDAALDAGKKNNKAVLVCFEGVRWCPYCVYADYELFDTDDFKRWAKENAYLVMIDNKLRGGYGPSIYNDDWDGGWLATHNVTLADGENALTNNAALQKKYALSWRQEYSKPIGYPTLLALNPTTGKVAGRIEPYFATVYDVAQLAELALASSEEDNEEADNYVVGATEVTAGTTTSATLSAIDRVDWRKFSVVAGEEWSFTVKSASSSDVKLTLYDVTALKENEMNYVDGDGYDQEKTGTIIGSAVSGDIAKGVTISHVFDATANVRLCIELPNAAPATDLLEYTLTASKVSDVNCEVSLPTEAISVNKYDSTVTIPVTITDHNLTNNDAITVAYTVSDDTAKAGTDFEYDASAAHELTWTADEKHLETVKYITIDLLGTSAIWEGSRDFNVVLTLTSGTGRIAPCDAVTVKLTAKPDFVSEDEQDVVLVRGVPMTPISIPVNASANNLLEVVKIAGELPSGMSLSASENNRVILLSGTPSEDAEDCSYTFGLRQTLDAKTLSSTEQKTLNFTIEEISSLNIYADPNYYLVSHSFVGNLLCKEDGDEYVCGVFSFDVTDSGLKLKLNTLTGVYEGTANWASYDDNGNFTAKFSVSDGTSVVRNDLTIVLDDKGKLTGTYAGNISVSGALRSVWNTSELAQFAEFYTAALKEHDAGGDHPDGFDSERDLISWGGIAFTLVADQNDDGEFIAGIEFTAKMRDGKDAVTGTAYLQQPTSDETGAATFCFFFPYTRVDDEATAYVGGKLSIMSSNDSDGEHYTVSACDNDGAARYCGSEVAPLDVCGIDYTVNSPLYTHIGEGTDKTFFFRVVTPSDLDNVAITAVPRSIKVTEDDKFNFTVEENPYNLTITADTDEDGNQTGFFHGSFDLYADVLGKQTVQFSGVYTPLKEACCSATEGYQPAGRGSYTVTDADGEVQRYNVRLYPGNLSDTEKYNTALTDSTLAISSQTAFDDYIWSDADKFSASDNGLHILAIDADGNVKFLTVDDKNMPSLSAGTWTLYFIGTASSDEYQLGKKIVITIHDVNDLTKLEYALTAGWNLLALPWDSGKILHSDFANLLALKPYIYNTTGRRLVRLQDALQPGAAFWLYSTNATTFTLHVAAGDSTNAPAFDDDNRHLCAPHANLDSNNAMLWQESLLRFSKSAPASNTQGGWFKLREQTEE